MWVAMLMCWWLGHHTSFNPQSCFFINSLGELGRHRQHWYIEQHILLLQNIKRRFHFGSKAFNKSNRKDDNESNVLWIFLPSQLCLSMTFIKLIYQVFRETLTETVSNNVAIMRVMALKENSRSFETKLSLTSQNCVCAQLCNKVLWGC